MKKLAKYSLIGGGILLLLIIAAVVVTPYLLNVDALREMAERQATARLGREVTIEDIRFSWAGPKIRLSGFSIAEAEGFRPEPFAQFDAFDLKLKIWELFRLRLSVQHILLLNPRVRVVRNKGGIFNFDDIIKHINTAKGTAAQPFAAMRPEGDGIRTPPVDLLVQEIRVERGELFFADSTLPRMDRGITCKNISLVLRDLSLDRPVSISASLGINRDGTDVQFKGRVGPVGKTIVPGRIPFDLNLIVEPFELTRLSQVLGPLPMALSGVVSASETVQGSISGGINFQAETTLQRINIRNLEGKHLLKDFNGSFSQDGKIDLNNRRLSLTASRLEAYQAVFEAIGSVSDLGPSPAVDLDITSNAIPLSGWDEVLPGLGLLVKLEGDLTFKGKVTGTVGKDLAADMAFTSQRFESDRGPALLERSSSEALAVPPEGAGPVEPLKAFPVTVTGLVSVKEGRFEKIYFSDMEARFSQRGTLFSLEDMALTVFSGSLTGSAWADPGTLPMAYGAKTSMSDVQLNEALAAIAGMDGILYSKVSMDVSVQGKGTEFADLEKHLSGRGAVTGGEGRFTTANLAGGAAKAASFLGIGGESGETRFDDMNASFTIEDGKVKVSSMKLSAGEWSMTAAGDIGLDKSLAMTSRMTLSQQTTARIPENRRKLLPAEPDGRVQIPLKIRGTILSPSVGLDSAAMSQAAEEEIKQEVREKTDDLKEKLQKDLGEKLKKLF